MHDVPLRRDSSMEDGPLGINRGPADTLGVKIVIFRSQNGNGELERVRPWKNVL